VVISCRRFGTTYRYQLWGFLLTFRINLSGPIFGVKVIISCPRFGTNYRSHLRS